MFSCFGRKHAGAETSSEDEHSDAGVPLRSRSDTLFVARRLYPEQNEEYIVRKLKELASLSNEEYALHELSCSVCHLYNVLYSRQIVVKNLSKKCHFCGILRKCQQHFGNDCKILGVYIKESTGNLQICFPDSKIGRCNERHVQLYSKELRMHEKPFRYAKAISESAGSETSISVMKDWISRCCTTHQHALPTHGCKPTRLIKLAKNEDDGAQLYSSKTLVEYAALSYRWGSGKQSETTKENVAERCKELKTSEFPKTLQDAIHVTRRLGLEYIWIDRICIVQDDEEEWAKEASLMADVYASAYVMLSATATEDCQDGFLQKRLEPFVIRYAQRGQETREVYARQVESHWCSRTAPKTEYTLFRRGWCMQERFLARRIIHFLPDEILFECQAGRECECSAASNEKGMFSSERGFSSFASLWAAHSIKGPDFADKWWAVIMEYSIMELTHGEDSLPALSGTAACMEHLEPGKYIAGLWQHDIALQLGWYVHPRWHTTTRRWKYPENVDILGPTFSWSSHVRPVYSGVERYGTSICTLESFDVDLATSNPYGQVRHAALYLNGRVVPGNDMIQRPKVLTKLGKYAGIVYFDSGLKSKYEELENAVSWESLICFGLYEYEVAGWYGFDALLLQPRKAGTGEYVRIGVVRRLEKFWFDRNAVARTITVV